MAARSSDSLKDYTIRDQVSLAATLSAFTGIAVLALIFASLFLGVQHYENRAQLARAALWYSKHPELSRAKREVTPHGETLIWLSGEQSMNFDRTDSLTIQKLRWQDLKPGEQALVSAVDQSSGESFSGVVRAYGTAEDPRAVTVLSSMSPQVMSQVGLVLASLLAMVFSLLAAISTGRIVSRVLHREISELDEDCREAHRSDARLPIQGSLEIRSIRTTINELLKARTQLEAQKQEFMRDVGHELRTPITAIAGHASFLLRRDPPAEQRKESLSAIDREAKRINELVSDISNLMRGSEGISLQMGLVEVHEAIWQAAETVRMSGKELQLELAGEADIEADPDRLQQILINIFNNACNAGATKVVARISTGTGKCAVSITDNGNGIEPELASRAFERFFRTDRSRQRDSGGSGLGLAICRMLIEAQGGEIELASEGIGKGAIITMIMPMRQPR